MIESIQKIIKIGSSAGVTLPSKTLQQENVVLGDKVKVTIEKVKPPKNSVMHDYAKFKKKYGSALKNLADR